MYRTDSSQRCEMKHPFTQTMPTKASWGLHKKQFSVQSACAPAQRDTSQPCIEPQPKSWAGGQVHELGFRAVPAWGAGWSSGGAETPLLPAEQRCHSPDRLPCWQQSRQQPFLFPAKPGIWEEDSRVLPSITLLRVVLRPLQGNYTKNCWRPDETQGISLVSLPTVPLQMSVFFFLLWYFNTAPICILVLINH